MSRDFWMQTASGHVFNFADLSTLRIRLDDIAHHLAHICRFGGACRTHYSVAQHSMRVADLCPPEHRLVALLHDATEAYIGDMVKPLKVRLPEFQQVEDDIWRKICLTYSLDHVMPACVKLADTRMLWNEMIELLPQPVPIDGYSDEEREPVAYQEPWPAELAERVFYDAVCGAIEAREMRYG